MHKKPIFGFTSVFHMFVALIPFSYVSRIVPYVRSLGSLFYFHDISFVDDYFALSLISQALS